MIYSLSLFLFALCYISLLPTHQLPPQQRIGFWNILSISQYKIIPQLHVLLITRSERSWGQQSLDKNHTLYIYAPWSWELVKNKCIFWIFAGMFLSDVDQLRMSWCFSVVCSIWRAVLHCLHKNNLDQLLRTNQTSKEQDLFCRDKSTLRARMKLQSRPLWKICYHVYDTQIFIGVCAFEMEIVSYLHFKWLHIWIYLQRHAVPHVTALHVFPLSSPSRWRNYAFSLKLKQP